MTLKTNCHPIMPLVLDQPRCDDGTYYFEDGLTTDDWRGCQLSGDDDPVKSVSSFREGPQPSFRSSFRGRGSDVRQLSKSGPSFTSNTGSFSERRR